MMGKKMHGFGFAITEDYKKAFVIHTKRIADGMQGFCMNALTSYREDKDRDLNESEMQQIVEFESMSVLQQLQTPEFLQFVREQAIKNFVEIQGTIVDPLEIAALGVFDTLEGREDF